MSDEVEILPDPFRIDICNVIELRNWFRRQNVLRLQNVVDQMGGFDRQLALMKSGTDIFGLFGGIIIQTFRGFGIVVISVELKISLFYPEKSSCPPRLVAFDWKNAVILSVSRSPIW